ncbi:hypothetical protein F2Q69_00037030 [Brassica cretica]|uniref:Uncharacterized protein n=1 Tax=Brassica cretica TaxID=69181 RepID=A0A8S9SG95_BRACR|nr:hypothetical protein F2Q69_00037030 [Brassica cretica]
MRIQKRTQGRTIFRPDRSLRSEWRVGLSSVATHTFRSLRSDRAVFVLGRYVTTELCNRLVALPFSAINLGVFCGSWENKFYPSEMFLENVFWQNPYALRFLLFGNEPNLRGLIRFIVSLYALAICAVAAGVFLPALL